MFTEIYIEALLVDEDLADQVWALWNARLISDDLAAWAWWIVANGSIHLRLQPVDALLCEAS